jgi:NADPH:quinone reductase-like Zn-dependent oxidoreductase
MSNLPTSQKLIVQSRSQASPTGKLPLAVAIEQPLPELQTEYDVLVRVLAAGLNPIDCKMVSHFYVEGQSVGCDFCGIVELTGHASSLAVGDRIFAGVLPYGFDSKRTGAFSQYAVVDSRRALQVPHDWSDTLAAGLGLLSWTTVALAMSKPDALALCGKPSTPVTTAIPVLVYGGGTATGVVAIQMLKQYVIPVPPNWSRHRLPTDRPSLSQIRLYTHRGVL